MQFIRQGATHKVVIGPFVDVGDGFTPETGVALSSADEAEVILHDGTSVVDISGYTWAAITTMDGYYNLTLQSGISGTVGHMIVVVNDDSVCLPVMARFTVLEEAVYDRDFAASATGVDADWTNAGRLDTILDSILADTGELQADDVPGLIATLDAVVDTVKAETALIVADTNELQTDDVPGLIATLDAVVDTVKAETALIVADTNELQTDDIPTTLAAIITDLDDIKGTGFVKDTHSLIDIETYVDILDDGTSGNAKIATDAAAILVDTGTTIPATITTVDSVVDAIKVTTDKLQFTATNFLQSDVQYVNAVQLQGIGTSGNSWRPV